MDMGSHYFLKIFHKRKLIPEHNLVNSLTLVVLGLPFSLLTYAFSVKRTLNCDNSENTFCLGFNYLIILITIKIVNRHWFK